MKNSLPGCNSIVFCALIFSYLNFYQLAKNPIEHIFYSGTKSLDCRTVRAAALCARIHGVPSDGERLHPEVLLEPGHHGDGSAS